MPDGGKVLLDAEFGGLTLRTHARSRQAAQGRRQASDRLSALRPAGAQAAVVGLAVHPGLFDDEPA